MRVRWRMTAAFAVLAAIAGGLLIFDATRADRIARGVRVAGLDVGGMTRAQARRSVQARLAGVAEHPIVVTWHDQRFPLAPRDPGLRPDAGATAGRIAAPVVISRRPDRTLKDIARRYPRVITISRQRKILRFYRHLKLAETFRIAVGQIGHKTPAGRYAIETMEKNPAWHVPDEAWAGDLAGRVIPPGDPQ